MKSIPLTQGKFALVDDDDYEWLSQWKWYAKQDRNKWYAVRKESPTKMIRMHRVILNAAPGVEVDHWDGDGLHNWRGNLRRCTTTQNQGNRGKQVNNTSGFKGVRPYRGKYQAQIQFKGKVIHIGYYATAEEAAHSYDEKARGLFGPFAKTNFS